jgi:hypothetical protein
VNTRDVNDGRHAAKTFNDRRCWLHVVNVAIFATDRKRSVAILATDGV